jgi:hypothetical protein
MFTNVLFFLCRDHDDAKWWSDINTNTTNGHNDEGGLDGTGDEDGEQLFSFELHSAVSILDFITH